MCNYKKFLWTYLALLLVCAAPVGLSLLLIQRSGENLSMLEVAKTQLAKGSLYGTGLNFNPFSYKLAMAGLIKPEVVVIGSSRTFCFRSEYFKSGFYNCSLGMNHLVEGRKFLGRLFEAHKPKLVLLALDPWMFNRAFVEPAEFTYHEIKGDEVTFDKTVEPFKLLYKGQLKLSAMFRAALSGRLENPLINYPCLGLTALTKAMGFRTDGSYLSYSYEMAGLKPFRDAHFARSFELIEKGGERFEHSDGLDPERLKRLKEIIALCRENGVELALFLTPFARPVLEKMRESGKYPHIDELRREAFKLGLPAFDFTDPESFEGQDCEFIDGFHGGDVTAMRMTLAMSEPGGPLAPYVKRDKLKGYLERFHGLALAKFQPGLYNFQETDFLKIGCMKPENETPVRLGRQGL